MAAQADDALSLADASAVTVADSRSHLYSCRLDDNWSVGAVPHGGYVATCFLRVAQKHFETIHARQHQPDALTLHLQFPRRTQVGPALFRVSDVKLGARTSLIHLTLVQNGVDVALAYITQTNLAAETGVTFPTDWQFVPAPPPVDLVKLRDGMDAHWFEQTNMPRPKFRRAVHRARIFHPRRGQPLRSLSDQWMTLRSGERWTDYALGYLCDLFPQLIDNYEPSDDPNYDPTAAAPSASRKNGDVPNMWFPTVLLNLDVKKKLPEAGVEWLFVRTQAKQIKNGRLDLEVIIRDEAGDLVALSHHVVLVLDASRNLKGRTRHSDKPKL